MTLSLFSKALGWALLNSLWQFGLLWIVFMLATGSFKNISSSRKHALALLLSISGVVWFVAGTLSGCYADAGTDTSFLDSFSSSSFSLLYARMQQFADKYFIYITYLYLVITGVQFAKFVYSLYQSHTIYTSGLHKAQVEVRLYVQKMASHLNISRTIRVFISDYVDTPLVIGFLKPTILMPLACVNQLSVPQLEAILLHELAHIKRNDYMVNIYVAVMEIVFFFNPFARLVLEGIKNEREHSCDDWVMQYQFNPHQYASALFTLEQNRTGYVKTGIAATGMSRRILLHRVQRIMKVQSAEKNNPVHTAPIFIAACIICLLAGMRPAMVTHKLFDYKQQLYSIAGKYSMNKHKAGRERQVSIMNEPAAVAGSAPGENKAINAKPVIAIAGTDQPDDNLFPVSVDEEVSNIPVLALNTESRNFSLPDEIQPDIPAVALAYSFPYVPSSSYYFSTDTAKPRIKPETYRERNAKESLLKAKKALNQINWATIEKSLPAKVNIMALRREIEKSIDQLNWQQIDEAVKDSINQQADKAYKTGLNDQAEEIKMYKTHQMQLEMLQNKLQLQQKALKTESELKEIDIQKQLAKYRIIVYL